MTPGAAVPASRSSAGDAQRAPTSLSTPRGQSQPEAPQDRAELLSGLHAAPSPRDTPERGDTVLGTCCSSKLSPRTWCRG